MLNPFKSFNKRKLGEKFEQQACRYLQKQGLMLKERNADFRVGEIDLVMQDGDTLVFVEVRFRAQQGFGGAAASVDRRKQQKLIKAAQLYLLKHFANNPPPCRFDVVAMEDSQQGPSINWIKNAFLAG
jgi:putative endonuclease